MEYRGNVQRPYGLSLQGPAEVLYSLKCPSRLARCPRKHLRREKTPYASHGTNPPPDGPFRTRRGGHLCCPVISCRHCPIGVLAPGCAYATAASEHRRISPR